ncbi:MAG: hypothetical protein AVDCRST_MAG59-3332, partial [uncultured Thermomicrobiales bacterium]
LRDEPAGGDGRLRDGVTGNPRSEPRDRPRLRAADRGRAGRHPGAEPAIRRRRHPRALQVQPRLRRRRGAGRERLPAELRGGL